MDTYLKLPAIEVSQPFGTFFITKIKARNLLELAFPNTLRIADSSGNLIGNQRQIQISRIKEISNYINTVECAFPNSIILAANCNSDGDFEENAEIRWFIENDGEDNYSIIVPTPKKLASIIDGQHRLYGFETVSPDKLEMELVCSIYFDLPNPLQAYIFATINFNQKKVDKSLAYELYGFNLDSEELDSWSPEKLAVHLTRKLNKEQSSPLNNHIIVAPQDDNLLFKISPKKLDWHISTATIVEGILSLISKHPKKDRDLMFTVSIQDGRSRSMLSIDNTPLRRYFIQANDLLIYKIIENYFSAANEILFQKAIIESYINKTIGIQALFDVLKEILLRYLEESKNISIDYYKTILSKVKSIDFSDNYFQASGVGRGRIRNTILYANELISAVDLKENDLKEIKRLLT